jgi:hypothetical protein
LADLPAHCQLDWTLNPQLKVVFVTAQTMPDDLQGIIEHRKREVRIRHIAVAVFVALAVLATIIVPNATAAALYGGGSAPAPTPLHVCLHKKGIMSTQSTKLNLDTAFGHAKFARVWSQTVALCGRVIGLSPGRLRSLEVDGRLQRFNQNAHKWQPVPATGFIVRDTKDLHHHVLSFVFYHSWHPAAPGTYRVVFHVELRSADHAVQRFSWLALNVG